MSWDFLMFPTRNSSHNSPSRMVITAFWGENRMIIFQGNLQSVNRSCSKSSRTYLREDDCVRSGLWPGQLGEYDSGHARRYDDPWHGLDAHQDDHQGALLGGGAGAVTGVKMYGFVFYWVLSIFFVPCTVLYTRTYMCNTVCQKKNGIISYWRFYWKKERNCYPKIYERNCLEAK